MATRRIRTDGFIDPCIPTLAAKPPSGPDWVHEIKHDGYRLIVRLDGKGPSRGHTVPLLWEGAALHSRWL
jgi:hypothetical protein